MLGFAIVGCGMIARFHARALADVPDTKLVALVSRKPANAKAVAEAAGVTCDIYSDLKPVLDRRDVNVFICGLKAMVDDVRSILKAAGFDRKRILCEKYD